MASSRLDILQLGESWFPEQPGGLSRFYHELLPELIRRDALVRGLVTGTELVAEQSAGMVRAFARPDAPLVVRLSSVRKEMKQALQARFPDLVVSHFALYMLPCLDLVRAAPLICHFHGPWGAESRAEGGGRLSSALKTALEGAVYHRASRIIVLSRAFARLITGTFRIPPDQVRIIPGAIDVDRFQPRLGRVEARKRLGWPSDRPSVLLVRRLVRRMGLEDLLASIRTTIARIPDVVVNIAGSGPLRATLSAFINSQALGGHVRLLGYLPAEVLPHAYRAADLTVVPSRSLEGFGLIVAESLAAGTPVLVTDVGGLPETLEGLAPQCILKSGAPGTIATAIADALEGRMKLPTPEECVTHARNHFHWQVVAERTLDVYREVVQ